MTDQQIRMRDALKAHQLRIQPSGGVCSCGEWTERPYGSVLWGPDDWEEHLEEALEAAGALTASEVKVLTETASKVAYALGRKDAGEEIALAIEQRRSNTAHRIPWEAFTDAANTARQLVADPKPVRVRREPCDTHCPCICHDGWGGAHPNQDCRDANATSQPSQAASDATSGVPGHQEVSEAARSPQEPCGHPTCPCAPQEAR